LAQPNIGMGFAQSGKDIGVLRELSEVLFGRGPIAQARIAVATTVTSR
jgi:hypothetical protein